VSVRTSTDRLGALTEAGTSVWLDQIRRRMIESGELERMVREQSLRGVTSNPAIFEKAILGSDDYDEQLRTLAGEGRSALDIYEEIAIQDVRMACDVLRPVHESTGGNDGFVSLEVGPQLARDPETTLREARDYWSRVDRRNLMIKIPGTPECLVAIEQALFDGINVNVTLLFAVSAYEQVMEAYIRAMERRRVEGLELDRHSVASFFVSRVDTEVDRRLEASGHTHLAGRAGVANGRAAYRAYQRVFAGERFAALRAAGCPVQRPLWASTGVKNPRYSDTLYIDELVAPDTVNTMPLPTLQAAANCAEIRGATAAEDPDADLEALREAGVDLSDVTDQLLREGIDLFVAAFDKLVEGIERKREAVVTGRPPTIEADLPGELEAPIAERIRRARAEHVVPRIWQRDVTVWAPPGTAEIGDRLGWLTITHRMREQLPGLVAWAEEMRARFDRFVLLGMGGSSLAPEVLRRSHGADNLLVLDSTEPAEVARVGGDLSRTCFIVATKSGGTIETLSQYRYFHDRLREPENFVAITDPGSSLLSRPFVKVFENDPDIGGRYSALSYFGLVPAALMGIDVAALLEQAQLAVVNCEQPEPNSGLWLGAVIGELARRGRDKLTLIVDPPLESFGLWAEQLVAESTGKHGRGILPIADEPLVDPGRYRDDRVFVYLRDESATHQGAVEELAAAGQPVLTLNAQGPGDLGRIFFFAEFATAVAGWTLEINPFDQPNVQEAKDNTAKALERGQVRTSHTDVALADLTPGAEYLAIMGYLPYSEEVEAAVSRLRRRVLERHGIATTFGYGPRFLHSTGQYHKGGPPSGAFLQLTHDGTDDLPVPGQPFTFRELIGAQADGDLQTLRDHGLRAAREILPAGDLAGAIDAIDL
jgi:transaldolase / glucose-6-phosphate isomerase